MIVYSCIVMQIKALKCIVEEKGGERQTYDHSDKQTARQTETERECTTGLSSKFADKTNN